MVKMLAICTLITGLLSCTSTGKQIFQAPSPVPEAHTPSDKHAIKSVGLLIVLVSNKKTGKTVTYSGSAFPIDYKGKILFISASHVCNDVFNRAAIAFAADEMYAINIAYAPKNLDPDICILLPDARLLEKVKKESLAYRLFEPVEQVPEHHKDGLVAYGWAHGVRLIKTWHHVKSVAFFTDTKTSAVRLNGNMYEGMSGGPLVDPSTNNVISVAIMDNLDQGISYVVMPPDLKKALDTVVNELK